MKFIVDLADDHTTTYSRLASGTVAYAAGNPSIATASNSALALLVGACTADATAPMLLSFSVYKAEFTCYVVADIE